MNRQYEYNINATSMGTCFFVPWDDLSRAANIWAKATFGVHAYAETTLENFECVILLSYLKASDFKVFSTMWNRYDKEGEYGSCADFNIGNETIVLPASFTCHIANELFGEIVGEVVANREGAFFMSSHLPV